LFFLLAKNQRPTTFWAAKSSQKLLGLLQIRRLYISLVFFGVCGNSRLKYVFRAQTVLDTPGSLTKYPSGLFQIPQTPKSRISKLQRTVTGDVSRGNPKLREMVIHFRDLGVERAAGPAKISKQKNILYCLWFYKMRYNNY